MAIRFFPPRVELRDVVERICAHESGDAGLAAARWLIVPDGDLKLIFPFRADISCAIGDAERRHRPARIIVSGMRTMPGWLGFPRGVGAILVVLKPETAHRLLPMPMHELGNRTFDGEELFGAAARRWQDTWMDLPTVEARVEAIQGDLLEVLRRGRERAAPRACRAPHQGF